jgi:1-aminocyclopropane-1-carboxylate deaminase/D-cysteine desulfhydrase-like pyridoxal-dependent ACC family enzyme
LRGLTKHLERPEIWIKRGRLHRSRARREQSPRKLDFLLAEARDRGPTRSSTVGADQSNHVRMTAAAARIAGMETVSLLYPSDLPGAARGNLLLDRILGTEIVRLPSPSPIPVPTGSLRK